MIKIGSWNVNSIRARLPSICSVLRKLSLDVVCLQEIKCEDRSFPYDEIEDLGYNCEVFGQKGFNGVALLSRFPIEDVVRGMGHEDPQSRYIEALVCAPEPIRIASVYVPNGNPAPGEKYEYKLEFMRRLHALMQAHLLQEEAFVLAGDFNCIPRDEDCWDAQIWSQDALALPQTRAQFSQLQHIGLTEAFTALDGRGHCYTFWDYQGRAWHKDHGVRIDHVLLSPQAADRLQSVEIFREARGMEKPSDHVPIYVGLRD